MDRYTVMVDAGYFLRQSIEVVSNRVSSKRTELIIKNPRDLINLLLEKSKTVLNLASRELLRVYWYDGVMATGLTPQQRSIITLPDVQFRAGTVNSAGKQKGVDSLIVTDLIELSANRAISDAALVTGDGDLAIAIELAQKKGVRIALLGIEDLSIGVSHKQNFEITSRADRIHYLNSTELQTVVTYAPQAAAPQSAATHAISVVSPTASVTASQKQPILTTKRILDKPIKDLIDKIVDQFIRDDQGVQGAIDQITNRINPSLDSKFIYNIFQGLNHGPLTIPQLSWDA